MIWSMSFEYKEEGGEAVFVCTCVAQFLGVPGGVKCSPSELRLTGIGGERDLARLEATHVLDSPNGMTYIGRGRWRALMDCVKQTMSPPTGIEALILSETSPPPRGMFCNVEIHLPRGHAGDAHESSNVKMDFELLGSRFQSRLVRVS